MKISEFEGVEDQGWMEYIHSDQIESSLGRFMVTMSIGDKNEPDQKMVDILVKLKEDFIRNDLKVLDFVFEDYKYWIEEEADNLEGVVPFDLTKENLNTVISDAKITISRNLINKYSPSYEAQIYFSPAWEEEHGFYMTLNGDAIDRTG